MVMIEVLVGRTVGCQSSGISDWRPFSDGGTDEGTGMKSVMVTGGSGKVGRAAIRELLRHGYQVMNVDTTAPAEQLCPFMT
jgi:NADPH:quinone reductase-like Zn-dependent oxidoreductase